MMFVPSGDQLGIRSSEDVDGVRFVCPVPSAFITQTSATSDVPMNAILSPFGDHEGWLWRPPLVIGWTSLPSAFITKICGVPLTTRANAIFWPSGDHVGEKSSLPDVSAALFNPLASITQIPRPFGPAPSGS